MFTRVSGLLDRRLIFVTGKGGVGKSTVACALVRAGAGLALLDALGVMGTHATDLILRPFHPSIKVMGRLVRPRHLLQSRLARDFIETLRDVIESQAATPTSPSPAGD